MSRSLAAILLASLAVLGIAQPLHAQETLDGVWEVTSVIDDGFMVPARTVRETLMRDGRLTIQGQLIQFTTPDGRERVRSFVTNPRTNPPSLDLAGADKVGSRGIYLLDEDNLSICLCGGEGQPRPSSFTSRVGQDTVLLTLRRVKKVQSPPPPREPPPTPPPAVPPGRRSDDDLRQMLVGTWGHQDEKVIQRMTLNPDGTFSATQQFKRGLRKVFDEDERISGRWSVKDGKVMATATAHPDKGKIGQIYSYTVSSITANEVVYIENQYGTRRIEWRLR